MKVASFASTPEWADYVAERVVALLAATPRARLCLATGATPVPVYERLVKAVRAGRASFRDAEVFLLDEFGGVPVDAAGRCDTMLRRALIDHVDLPDEQYHRIDTESADVDAVCRAYDAAILGTADDAGAARANAGAAGDADASVRGGLDLTILGIGTNGHIGMNEPGSAPDGPTRRVDLASETIESAARYFGGAYRPTWGITIGFRAILASREIWMLATGAAKAPIVRRVLTEPVSPALPATLLRPHTNCILLTDAPALPLHSLR